jgi:hypothetical protein
VHSLRAYIDSYQGGRLSVRSMEGMIQQIAQDCANALGAYVKVSASLSIDPDQQMSLSCAAFPLPIGPSPVAPVQAVQAG